jgi:hypothetical protein
VQGLCKSSSVVTHRARATTYRGERDYGRLVVNCYTSFSSTPQVLPFWVRLPVGVNLILHLGDFVLRFDC